MPIPLASIIAQGLDAAKPAAGTAGRVYFATDSGIVYYDTGTVWSEVDLAGSAGFSLDSLTGAVSLVAGANIAIQDNTPAAGKIKISATVPAAVSSLDSIQGAITLVAGANIAIQDNTPSAGEITISAAGGGAGGYLKGTVNLPAQSGGGTFTASGTVAGAAVGDAVVVSPNNSTQASLFTNVSGWVSAANTVTIQVTTTVAFIGQYLLVTVFP